MTKMSQNKLQKKFVAQENQILLIQGIYKKNIIFKYKKVKKGITGEHLTPPGAML